MEQPTAVEKEKLVVSPPSSKSKPNQPKLFRDTKNQVYVKENGTMVKLGQLVVNEKGEQTLRQTSKDKEPANKKERRKQKAGLPYRSKR